MIVHLADHYGLCFGVRDAIAQAEQLARRAPLTILGQLVHNPLVRDQLASQGAVEGSLHDLASAATPQVMITAHGASDRARELWRRSGFGVADGTCPLVRHAHDQLRVLVELGYFPVVIGIVGHVEVQGLVGDFPEAVVIGSENDLPRLENRERFGVISQTTQPIERVQRIVEAMRCAFPQSEVRFVDTVCQPTKNRQSAIAKLIARCDTIVVVGGKNSNNTLQLANAARVAGLRVIHIESAAELDADSFKESREVGLTAGTSTLKETVQAAHARLEEIARELSRNSDHQAATSANRS
jgi:4-hydroxy-3-methylbut-2-enyl diphosphate reductase